jgi:phosphoribosylanthranilate isomerase
MTRQILNKVTVTGVDDGTDLKELQKISDAYPFVEFGVLLSRSQMCATPSMHIGRFPSVQTLKKLTMMYSTGNVNFAGHLCGSWVRELLVSYWPFKEMTEKINLDFWKTFKRLQINTHAELHAYEQPHLSYGVNELNPTQIIFQYDEVNKAILETTQQAGCKNISALFDMSHGAGILPKTWPKQLPDIYCGYAGGLYPENVGSQLTMIEQIVGTSPIWIDAETSLRSSYYNNDAGDQGFTVDYFDLRKVVAFLEAAKPWVIIQ